MDEEKLVVVGIRCRKAYTTSTRMVRRMYIWCFRCIFVVVVVVRSDETILLRSPISQHQKTLSSIPSIISSPRDLHIGGDLVLTPCYP